MGRRIFPLDSLTIDKIAAGEVIDVPSSCVKELVENSLDAGATEILVEVALGGRELIRVTDNGCGMGREDVIASIDRHSTSKLRQIDDLERLSSRGFRGEALASIVAVSHVTLISAERNGEEPLCPATALEVEGGKVTNVLDTKARPGTSVQVSSLFFNVPARRKFLKSPSKDTADISKTVTCLALAAPNVAFRLFVDGLCAIDVKEEPTTPLLSRIRALFKAPFQNSAFEVHYSREGFLLTGVIADPCHARSTRSGQYLIVNGRCVHSLPISYAVKNAFGTTCEEGKHPLFALHLNLDPASIDVNVHPQKKEIRFSDEEWVRQRVQESVSEALFGKKGFAPTSCFSSIASTTSFGGDFSEDPFSEWRPEVCEEAPVLPLSLSNSSSAVGVPVCLGVVGDVALIKPPTPCDPAFPVPHDSLLLLDLKQAMRAVTFQQFQSPNEPLLTELFLVPVIVECSVPEAALISSNIPYFEKQGVLIRSLSAQSFLIEGAPKQFLDLDLSKFIIDVCQEEVLSTQDLAADLRNKRLATAYVASMKSMKSPIDSATASSVLTLWAKHNFPAFAPDGSHLYSQFTPSSLKEWIAKGGAPIVKSKRGN